ncbi:hypothetical protein OPV22_003336 [Ensete ventricosum]|uniref:Uncharacterized protein n=1 Tax=Ensete ventricosum TaxID=4639 RepID=A0AAV8S0K8_ENSVE|nr:hypothetical protein OPV22_003336 [Ensete ventricosum]
MASYSSDAAIGRSFSTAPNTITSSINTANDLMSNDLHQIKLQSQWKMSHQNELLRLLRRRERKKNHKWLNAKSESDE